jgi:hypothetical protein
MAGRSNTVDASTRSGGGRGSGRAAIQFAITHGLGDVTGANHLRACEIGDGSCDFEHAVIGACGQRQPGHRRFQQLPRRWFRAAIAFDFTRRQPRIGFAGALQLPFAAAGHALAHAGAGFGGGVAVAERGTFDPRHVDVQIDTVEQRAGDAGAIAQHLIRRAAAFAGDIAQISAGA